MQNETRIFLVRSPLSKEQPLPIPAHRVKFDNGTLVLELDEPGLNPNEPPRVKLVAAFAQGAWATVEEVESTVVKMPTPEEIRAATKKTN